MKENIHPNYFQTTVTCVGCGTTFTTGSTTQNIRVDICSHCHPFYTGQKKLVDTEGRVERFTKRVSRQTEQRKPKPVEQPQRQASSAKRPEAAAAQADQNRPKSLREMLQEAANQSQ